MSVSVDKKTAERLHNFCKRGEKYDNLLNRLLDVCEAEKRVIVLSDKTVKRLLRVTGCKDVDEGLNLVLDKCRNVL